MKTIFALFLTVVGLSSFTCTSAYERKVNNDEERRLRWGWSKNGSDKSSFEKYFDIYDRCCGDDIEPTNKLGPVNACNCPIRGIEYFGLYRKWNYKCDTKIKAKASVVGLAASMPDTFSTLVDLVTLAELDGALSRDSEAQDKKYTVFAPTNAAFGQVDGDIVNSLIASPKVALTDILLSHVVEGEVTSKMLSDGQEVETMSGKKLKVSISDGVVKIGPAIIGTATTDATIDANLKDIPVSNGVLHVVDAVLNP